jgi:hypothetical protein
MNKLQTIFPWISVNVSAIPTGIKRVLSGNVNWAQVSQLAKSGNKTGAAALIAGGMMSGPIGLIVFGNLLNYLLNDRWMHENDPLYRTSVQIGDGMYLDLDMEMQRSLRILGMKRLMGGTIDSPQGYTKALGEEVYKQFRYMLNPGIRAVSEGDGGKQVPAVWLQKTADRVSREGMTGEAIGKGLIEDVQQNLLPVTGVRFGRKGPPRTAAEMKVNELGFKSDEPMTAEDRERSKRRREAVDANRSGNMTEFRRMLLDPKMTPQDRENIRERLGYPDDLAYRLSGLAVSDALEVWGVMSGEQKEKYRRFLVRKISNSELLPAEKREAMQRVR